MEVMPISCWRETNPPPAVTGFGVQSLSEGGDENLSPIMREKTHLSLSQRDTHQST